MQVFFVLLRHHVPPDPTLPPDGGRSADQPAEHLPVLVLDLPLSDCSIHRRIAHQIPAQLEGRVELLVKGGSRHVGDLLGQVQVVVFDHLLPEQVDGNGRLSRR